MKIFIKFSVGMVIGILLIVSGIAMNGLEHLSIPLLSHLQVYSYAIDDVRYTQSKEIKNIKLDINNAQVKFIKTNQDDIEIHAKNVYNKFKIYEEGNQVIIKQPHYLARNKKANIEIKVPNDFTFNQLKLEVGAGKVSVNELYANNVILETGAGALKVGQIDAHQLNVKTGMGDTKLKHVLCNQLKIDLGMGNVEATLQDKIEEYGYNVGVGLGNVNLGEEKFSGIAQDKTSYSTKERKIDIVCGMGNVDIKEMEEN